MGAAAVMGGAMDGLLSGANNNSNQEQARRASTPSSTGGGFSSIFSLKSVLSAATKTAPSPQPAPATSNFYVSPPPVASEPIAVDSPSHTAPPQKSVQGIVGCFSRLRVVCFCFLVFASVCTF